MAAAVGSKSVGSSCSSLGGPRLLRKPRAPAPLQPLPASPPPKSITSGVSPSFSYTDPERLSPLPSLHPSVVSPPPPSELHSVHHFDSFSGHSRKTALSSVLRKGDLPYVLDPAFREKTQLGTYVEGQSLVKPYKVRGPDGLPARPPKTVPPILHVMLDEEDERYYEPSAFTLQDFLIHLSETHRMPLKKVKEAVFSKHNYKKIQKIIADKIKPIHAEVKQLELRPSDDMPHVTPRIPQRQLLLEMAALVKEQMSGVMGTEMKSVIRKLPKYSPSYKPGQPPPHTEILLYEANKRDEAQPYMRISEDAEMPVKDNMFQSSSARYFQGSKRSNSPFSMPDEGVISPAELAVLDSLMNGGFALSLKANFISHLPDLLSLSGTITYLNISFNDFRTIPFEIFGMKQLTVLKFRNNPVKEIPPEIGLLTRLKALVFPFCKVSSLPLSLFNLPHLERLDMAYNRISFLPNEIRNLVRLKELNVEGNQLPAMPVGCLRLTQLQWLKLRNNMMHPLFWAESSQNQPQRLLDLACLTFHNSDLHQKYPTLPENVLLMINNHTICECCMGPLYGEGMRIIRPVSRIFNIKNIPILFRSCSPYCKMMFMNNTESLTDLLYGNASADQMAVVPVQQQNQEEINVEA